MQQDGPMGPGIHLMGEEDVVLDPEGGTTYYATCLNKRHSRHWLVSEGRAARLR